MPTRCCDRPRVENKNKKKKQKRFSSYCVRDEKKNKKKKNPTRLTDGRKLSRARPLGIRSANRAWQRPWCVDRPRTARPEYVSRQSPVGPVSYSKLMTIESECVSHGKSLLLFFDRDVGCRLWQTRHGLTRKPRPRKKTTFICSTDGITTETATDDAASEKPYLEKNVDRRYYNMLWWLYTEKSSHLKPYRYCVESSINIIHTHARC